MIKRSRIWQVAIALAICVVLATFIFALATSGKPTEFALEYLAMVNSFLLLLLLVVGVLYGDLRRSRSEALARANEKAASILRHLDAIFQERTKFSLHMLTDQDDQTKASDPGHKGSSFLKFLVDETRAMFEEFTGEPCAVSIKLLVPGPKGPVIRTAFRDRRSFSLRRSLYGVDGMYPYEDHSPFADIISGKPHRDFFLSNDLRDDHSKAIYRNGNKHWKDLYNSTLIVPIREPATVVSKNIVGFLCIDSLTAKFDESVCVYMSRIVANTVFYVVYALSVVEKRFATANDTSDHRRPTSG